MKKVILGIISFCFLFYVGCKEDELTSPVIDDNYTPVFGIEDVSAAKEELSEYYIFGTFTNGAIQVTSKVIGNTDIPNVCNLNAVFRGDLNNASFQEDGGDFSIKNIQTSFENDSYNIPTELQGCDNLGEMYATEVPFSLERNGLKIIESSIYSPARINSFQPTNAAEYQEGYSHYWLDKSEVFNFSFNADLNNPNGVLLVAMGKGDILGYEPSSNNNYTYKVKLFEDNGNASLPAGFFDDYLEDELITISLYRGAFNLINADDGLSYKVYTMSEIKQEFIVKN